MRSRGRVLRERRREVPLGRTQRRLGRDLAPLPGSCQRHRHHDQRGDLLGPRQRQLRADEGAGAIGQHVELADAHGVEEITQRRGIVGHGRMLCRRIRFTQARQIRRVQRAIPPGERHERREGTSGAGQVLDTQHRRTLLEATPGWHGVVQVELAEAALEVTATHARKLRRRLRSGGLGHAQ